LLFFSVSILVGLVTHKVTQSLLMVGMTLVGFESDLSSKNAITVYHYYYFLICGNA